jgi:hypothetical protein
MSVIQKVTYKGKAVFVSRFSGQPAQIIPQINEAAKTIRSQPKGSVLLLTDVKDGYFANETVDAFKVYARDNKPYVAKSAIIGLSAVKKFVVNVVSKFGGRDLKAFDSEQAAKDYLVS